MPSNTGYSADAPFVGAASTGTGSFASQPGEREAEDDAVDPVPSSPRRMGGRTRRIAAMYALCLGVTGPAGCFDGRDALGLPCEKDFQCGNGQVCAEGFCAWPGGAGTTGGPATSSSAATSVASLSGPDGTTSTSTSGTTSQATTTGSDSSSDSSSTGGPDPIEGCAPGAVLRSRDIELPGEGRPVAVGSDRFGMEASTYVIVATANPGQLLAYEFVGIDSFEAIDSMSLPTSAVDLATGDLDGDSSTDIVVVLEGTGDPRGQVYWSSRGGAGLFDDSTPLPEGLPPAFSVDIGPLIEGAEDEQLLVSGGGDNNSATMIVANDGVLELGAVYPDISSTPWETVIADLDGTPPAEALVVGSNADAMDLDGSDRIHVLRHDMDMGMWAPPTPSEPLQSPFSVAAGNLDRSMDGSLELVVVGKNLPDGPSEIGICRLDVGGKPDCDTWEPGPEFLGFNNVRLADINCDDELDAVITASVTGSDDGDVFLAFGPLQLDFQPQRIDDVPTGAVGNRIAIADITGDSYADIIVPLSVPNGAGVSVVRVFSFEVP